MSERLRTYSPQLPPDLIHRLWLRKQETGRPITRQAADFIRQGLDDECHPERFIVELGDLCDELAYIEVMTGKPTGELIRMAVREFIDRIRPCLRLYAPNELDRLAEKEKP